MCPHVATPKRVLRIVSCGARQVFGRHADARGQGCPVHPCAVTAMDMHNIHALAVSQDSPHTGVNATTVVTYVF